MQSPRPPEAPAFKDQKWYEHAREFEGLDAAYKLLTPSPEKVATEFDRFENGEIERPDLRPDRLPEVDEAVDRLLALKADILADEPNSALRLGYQWRINELIANARIAQAAYHGDASRFEKYNRFVYGQADRGVAAFSIAHVEDFAQGFAHDKMPGIRETHERTLDWVTELRSGLPLTAPKGMPSEELFRQIAEQHQPFFTELLRNVRLPEGRIKGEMARTALRQMLQNVNAPHALVQSLTASMGVNNAKLEFEAPENPDYPIERFVGLGGHEIRHAMHYLNALRLGEYGLLALGLDRFEKGSEGTGVLTERVAYPTLEGLMATRRQTDLTKRHLIISMATGAFGKPATFEEVYARMRDLEILQAHQADKKGLGMSELEEKARTKLRPSMRRFYKGTDAQMAAAGATCYRKDKLYSEGEIDDWAALEANPKLAKYIDIGRIDLANARHIALLIDLGVIPAESIE